MKTKSPEEIRKRMEENMRNNKPMVRIFYQDFVMNAPRQFSPEGLIFKPENAVHVCTLAHDGESKEEIADKCYRSLQIDRPVIEQIFKSKCNEAGHTSMSIGDFVVFDDGEALLCIAGGWEKHKFTQK